MDDKNSNVIVKVAILLMFVAQASSFKAAGPYDITNLQFLPCEDQGTNELNFSIQMYRTQDRTQRILAHRGSLTWPSNEDSYRVFFSAYKWGTDWTPMMEYDGDFCKVSSAAPEFYSDMCKALGVNATCPLPPGHYTFEDWIVRIKLRPPILPYGKYKTIYKVYREKKNVVVGCVYALSDVVQKIG